MFSLSALPFLYYYFNIHPPFKAFALFSPILDFTGKLFGSSFLFKTRLNVQFIGKNILSDTPSKREEIEKSIESTGSVSRRLVKDLKRISAGFPENLKMESIKVNAAVFFGEADPAVFVSGIDNFKDSLKIGNVSIFGYHRVKHILFYDKYWEKTEDDLSLFLSGLAF